MRTATRLLKTAILCVGIVAAAGCRSSDRPKCPGRLVPVPLPADDAVALNPTIEPVPVETSQTNTETQLASFEPTPETVASAAEPQAQVTGMRMPTPRSKPAAASQQPPQMATRTDAADSAGDETSMAHAEDYSWLQGTLEYVHSNSGRWKLRYAPLWAEDRFGGSIALDPDAWLEKFHEGDVIYVEGEVAQSRPSAHAPGPVYRVHSIRPLHVTP